jgi:hypothetical protein
VKSLLSLIPHRWLFLPFAGFYNFNGALFVFLSGLNILYHQSLCHDTCRPERLVGLVITPHSDILFQG